MENKKSKGKVSVQTTRNADGKKTSKGKVAVATTTTVTSATKHKANAKPLEFDFNAASFNIDETKSSRWD
jgi:hypothetical protein